jgi:hypothetical protein
MPQKEWVTVSETALTPISEIQRTYSVN